jgi:bifunctional non-homologous end joining protein LigD
MRSRTTTLELDLPLGGALPGPLRPMLAMPAAGPFDSPEYAFEVAWNGVRALASFDGSETTLSGRGLADLTSQYPEVQALRELTPADSIVDGELIVTDPEGRPDPAGLQEREHARTPAAIVRAVADHPVTYVVYDLLYLRGRSMMSEPLHRRQAKLRESVRSVNRIYVADPVVGEGIAFFDAAREKGLEGVIAKRLDSPYRSGQRHPDWLMVQAARQQDFVVLGFVPGTGSHLLESLVVGTYDGAAYHPAGTVVGGFDPLTVARLRKALDPLPNMGTPADRRWADSRICWVEPRVVVGVKFSEWTSAGQLRFPIFSGLRPDVSAAECVRSAVIEPPLAPRPRTVDVHLPRLPI